MIELIVGVGDTGSIIQKMAKIELMEFVKFR